MFDYSAVNWLAVIIAAVANVVIGTVWYLPQVFGKQWAALTGREVNTSPNPMLYVIAILGSLITAYVLALVFEVVMSARGPVSFIDGIVIGLIASIGFQVTSLAVGGAFEGRSWTLFAINAGNSLVSFAVMGAILAAMS
ncbi:MAG TPA: DUF1761 domain-containing protein [Patescibacteria group bacterium]|jgi:hypothetical protein|nr:DUF1761 domain-containing protein [Patescibacteria group bacterium]